MNSKGNNSAFVGGHGEWTETNGTIIVDDHYEDESEWELEAWPINGSPQSGFTLNLDDNIFKSDEDFQLDAQDHKDVQYVAQMAAGLTYAGTFNHNYDTTQTTFDRDQTQTLLSLTTPQSNRSIWTEQSATTPHDHNHNKPATTNINKRNTNNKKNPKILHQITSTPSQMKSAVTITASTPNNNHEMNKHRLSSNLSAKSKFIFTAANSGGTGQRYTDSYSTQNNKRASTPTPSTVMVKNRSANEETVIIHDNNNDQLLITPTHLKNTNKQSFVSQNVTSPISPSIATSASSHHLLSIYDPNQDRPPPSKPKARPHACLFTDSHDPFLRLLTSNNVSQINNKSDLFRQQ